MNIVTKTDRFDFNCNGFASFHIEYVLVEYCIYIVAELPNAIVKYPVYIFDELVIASALLLKGKMY